MSTTSISTIVIALGPGTKLESLSAAAPIYKNVDDLFRIVLKAAGNDASKLRQVVVAAEDRFSRVSSVTRAVAVQASAYATELPKLLETVGLAQFAAKAQPITKKYADGARSSTDKSQTFLAQFAAEIASLQEQAQLEELLVGLRKIVDVQASFVAFWDDVSERATTISTEQTNATAEDVRALRIAWTPVTDEAQALLKALPGAETIPVTEAHTAEQSRLQELAAKPTAEVTSLLSVSALGNEGASFDMVNGTPYNWHLIHSHSYQMNAWNFPQNIAAGSAIQVYVEFNGWHNTGDDGGEARYQLDGTDYWFEVQARSSHGWTLQVQLSPNMGTQGNANGSVVPIGFWHDHTTSWILSGRSSPGPGSQGDFISNNLTANNWMSRNYPTINARPLRHICMPGSHDSGMSVLGTHTAGVTECNVLTQYVSIGDQLNLGHRYFDIRPVWSGSEFKCGHYTDKRGGNGQTLTQVIQQVNAFTAANKELIILNVSGMQDTNNWQPLNPDQYKTLFTQFTQVNYRYTQPAPSDFTTLPLSHFIGNNQACVLIIVEAESNILSGWSSSGLFPYSTYNAYNSYSDSSDLNAMEADQLSKLNKSRQSPDNQLFLLSWTLTQQTAQAIGCVVGAAPPIRDLADQATPKLPMNIFNAITKQKYPNILYIDGIKNSDAAAVAMAIMYNTV